MICGEAGAMCRDWDTKQCFVEMASMTWQPCQQLMWACPSAPLMQSLLLHYPLTKGLFQVSNAPEQHNMSNFSAVQCCSQHRVKWPTVSPTTWYFCFSVGYACTGVCSFLRVSKGAHAMYIALFKVCPQSLLLCADLMLLL